MQIIDQYSHEESIFTPFDGIVLTREDFFGELPIIPEGSEVFALLNLYDIERTMVRALDVVGKRVSGCFVSVFGAPRTLQKIVSSETNTKLIVESTIPPDGIDDKDLWKKDYIAKALGAGCVGAIIDFEDKELMDSYPDRQFFRRIDISA